VKEEKYQNIGLIPMSQINLTDDSLMDESRECISLLLGKHRKEPKNESKSSIYRRG
jgi:hypothetical protein